MIKKDQNKADLQISSFGMRNTIKMKMDWDPVSHFEKIMLQQIEEMERLEFAEETFRQDNNDTNNQTNMTNIGQDAG